MPRASSAAPARRNFHVPLPDDLYRALQAEAERTRRPANALAREAIAHWVGLQRQERIDQEILAYVQAMAGTAADLDPALEVASLESLEREV